MTNIAVVGDNFDTLFFRFLLNRLCTDEVSFIALGGGKLFNLILIISSLELSVLSVNQWSSVSGNLSRTRGAYFGDFSSRWPVTNLPTFALAPN